MRSMSWLRRAAACLGLALPATVALAQTAGGSAAAPKPPTVEAFFQPATLQGVALSPSGRWLAAQVARPGERAVLVISDLEDKEPAKVVAAFTKHDVDRVRWVSDEMLVFSLSNNQDRSREAEYKGRGLVSVQRDGERMRLLVKREWDTDFPSTGPGPLEGNYRLLAMGKAGTDEIIVGEVVLDPTTSEVARVRPMVLNVRTGHRRTPVNNPPAGATGWWFDHLGRARIASSSMQGKITFHWHEAQDDRWRELGTFDALHTPYWPEFVDGAGHVYVSKLDKDGVNGLYRFDVATGKASDTPLVSTPGFDDDIHPVRDRDAGDLLGVNVLTDGRGQSWFTPAMGAMQAKVDKLLPGRINLLRCAPCDKPRTVLVHSYSDRHPGEYLVHFPESGKWQRLGLARPAIDPAQMGTLAFHRIKARDGAELPLWVTQPAGPPKADRPAVVLVHGGPWSRGAEWAWNEESQFLASRGYVVIEPEFRGSTGYGNKHYRAGWKQWGQAMQDDVTDSLRFAIAKGWVDPKRVCIAGASYGGYSTLMGLAKDPDLYRCGVAWIGVSDPRLMFSIHWSDIGRDSKRHFMPQLIGDPVKDAELLKANAPVELAAKIKAPVMLVYGALDRRVPIEHGERMREVLRQAGNPPEWHVYDDEAHGWRRPENIMDFWRRVDTFLARHLKP